MYYSWGVARVGLLHKEKQARNNNAKRSSICSNRGMDLICVGMVTIRRPIYSLVMI